MNHFKQQRRRHLWQEDEEEVMNDDCQGSKTIIDSENLRREFSSIPISKPFLSIWQGSFVVGQEFVLVAYFLARHRQILLEENGQWEESQHDLRQVVSHLFVLMALLLILLYSNKSDSTRIGNENRLHQHQQQTRRVKIEHRSMDAILLAILLRLLAAVLRTLTQSYSSDTVHALANAGFMMHMITCDYSYANGHVREKLPSGRMTATPDDHSFQRRPAFHGGIISLNAAFFSTTLLASRLASNARVYSFVSLAVVLFAFYPAARHGVSQHPYGPFVHLTVIFLLLTATLVLLISSLESYLLASGLGIICITAPVRMYYLQRLKRVISGPWDVAHIKDILEGDQKAVVSNL